MDEQRPRQSPVTPNRLALILIIAFANGIAFLPYFLLIDRLLWLPAAPLGAAVLAFFALRRLSFEATTTPSAGEWLLAAWSSVAQPAIGSLMGVALFGAFYGGVHLFIWAAHYIGFAPHADPWAWGFWGSIWWIVIVVLVIASDSARDLFWELYPHEAGAYSSFYPLLARPWTLALGALAGLVVLGLMIWQLDPHSFAFAALLPLVLFFTSLPLSRERRGEPDRSHVEIVDVLATVLQDAGYRIVRRPQTGKAEIDPLLRSVDLLARSSDRAFAVQVKSTTSPAPVEWTEASALPTAALLLSDEIETSPDSSARAQVEPVLMLVGGTIAQSLAAFSQRERVSVVHFENAAATHDRQEFARRLQEAGLVFPSPPAASSALA